MNPTVSCTALALGLAWAGVCAADDGLRRCRAIAEAQPRLACYDALPLSATTPPAAPPAPTPPAAAAAERFGLPQVEDDIRIESRFVGRFEGWSPRERLRLANGQVWQVVDDSRGTYWLDSPRVVVRRGALGSFVMEIEGAKALIRVRRVE